MEKEVGRKSIMETLRKNAAVLMIALVALIAIVGFGIRSEGRLSALESKAVIMESDIAKIDAIQTNINNMNITLTQVETDIVWIKDNATAQTEKIDLILERLNQ